jgi:hypothetical protein
MKKGNVMGVKNLKQFLTLEEFQRDVASWSSATFYRRVKNEGFPAIKDNQRWMIPREEMQLWFKKRMVKPDEV